MVGESFGVCCPVVTNNFLFLKETTGTLLRLRISSRLKNFSQDLQNLQNLFRSRWISPMNNVIAKYYWYSDSFEQNDWHKITLLTYYSQVNYKGRNSSIKRMSTCSLPFFLSHSSPSSIFVNYGLPRMMVRVGYHQISPSWGWCLLIKMYFCVVYNVWLCGESTSY